MTTPLPCCKCGRDTGHTVELTRIVSAIRPLCEPCFDVAMEGFREHQRQFEELLAAGVSRHEANRIMIARIDGEAVS
jgi:hypothetical protein